MQLTTVPPSDTIATGRAMPIWLVPMSEARDERAVLDVKTQPLARCVAIIERLPAGDFARKTGRPEGPPLACPIQPLEFRPEPIALSPLVAKEQPVTKIIPEMLPMPKAITTPAPVMAPAQGIWAGTSNSYPQRCECPPRLREGGRVVHTLRLAPAVPVNEACKISAA